MAVGDPPNVPMGIQTAIPLGFAGDPCAPQPEPCIYFSPDSTSPISQVFSVNADEDPLQILAFDLKPGESVTLEMVWGGGAGEAFAPVVIGGHQFQICHPNNVMLVPISGRFRLVFDGILGEAIVVCQPTSCCLAQIFPESKTVMTPYELAGLLNLKSCQGLGIVPGTALATCVDLEALRGAVLTPATLATAIGFKNCDGALVTAGTAIATCADLAEVAAAAPRAVLGSGPYTVGTNILALNLAGGTSVPLDMTPVIADVLASLPQNGRGITRTTNVFLGNRAGDGVTYPSGGAAGLENGQGIVAIGNNVLADGAYGHDYSVFIGYDSGRSATGGYCTVAVGLRTGSAITTGEYNTLIGCDSGKDLTTGGSNVFVGAKSGLKATAAYNNVGVGTSAGYDLTSGFGNVFVGPEAGGAVTAGAQNVAIGDRALRAAVVVQDNVAIGKFALRLLTTGTNIAIGANAMGFATDATQNVVIGSSAGSVLGTGTRNTLIGDVTGYSLAAGGSMTAVGWGAGRAATTGNHTLIGDSAGYAITTGAFNTYVGRSAGAGTVGGSLNTAVGDSALAANTAGGYLAAFGFGAMGAMTSSYSVGIGAFAGMAGATGGADVRGEANTFLGYRATGNTAATAAAIAIGADAVASARTGTSAATKSPGIALGSAAYPVGVQGDGQLYATAGATAGYMVITINGVDYKLALEALA